MRHYVYLKFLLNLCVLISSPFAFSAPDLTIVGFFEPDGGIGKVATTILETLGEDITSNLVCITQRSHLEKDLPPTAIACLQCPDKEDGKVALLTDLICVHDTPTRPMPQGSLLKIAYSMLETTQIPSTWVSRLNAEFDAVVVPDPYVLTLYQNSGVTIPIFVLPLPMILDPYLARAPHGNRPKKPFVFGDMSARKNPKTLIQSFVLAFHNNPNVILFMRAGALEMENTRNLIKKYKAKHVFIETGKIPLSEYIDRLTACDCYVNLSRGEGFSYIPRECLALGIPVIITNNTASTTICDTGLVRAVPSTIKGPANLHYFLLFGEPCGEQFDCKVKDVVTALRDVYNNYSTYSKKAQQGREWVKQYDCKDPLLQAKYRMLIKPTQVLLGNENQITEHAIITNSESLYQKYIQLLSN